MSVRTTEYIIIGANVGVKYMDSRIGKDDDEWYEENDSLLDNTEIGGMSYILDAYGSKYYYIGEVLDSCGDYTNRSRLTKTELDYTEEELETIKERVKNYILEKFGLEVAPKMIRFTHKS